jgi:8-oxo-dGTP diphosphatase
VNRACGHHTVNNSPPSQVSVPQPAVSCAVFRDGRVLLVERGKGAATGLWSLPGGHIELGETAAAAALRELREETGVEAELVGVAGVRDVVQRNDRGDVLFHRVIIVFGGRWRAGEAQAASDARNVTWRDPGDLSGLTVTEGLDEALKAAGRLVRDRSTDDPGMALGGWPV